jgi:uncharacterized membrane protein
MDFILTFVGRAIFGKLDIYTGGYSVLGIGFFQPFFILALLTLVTCGLYVLSRVQRKKQTRKPLRITTTKALLIPTIMLTIYIIWLIWSYLPFLSIDYSAFCFHIKAFCVSGFGVFVPCLLVATVCSYFMGKRQRRKEQQQTEKLQQPAYQTVTD